MSIAAGSRWAGFTAGCSPLREVGLSSLPGDLRRPQPGGPIQEIPISLERAGEGWLAQAVKETAQRRKEEKASP